MGKKYIPINIRLTEEQYERLRREAFETKKSQAEIIREALEKHWKEVDQTKKGRRSQDRRKEVER
jgi:predicted DNA-binding protein